MAEGDKVATAGGRKAPTAARSPAAGSPSAGRQSTSCRCCANSAPSADTGDGGPPRRSSLTGLDLAVEDLVGDCGESGADGAGGNAVEGGAGGVDLGLGGAAGLAEGG